MAMKLSDDVEKTSRPLSLGEPETQYTDEYNDERALKLDLTLGDISPGYDVVRSSLSSGNAKQYERLLADRDRLEKIETRNDILSSVMQADPSQITPEVVSMVQGLSDEEITSPDIENILEKKYSKLYTNMAVAAVGNDIVQDAIDADPEKSYDLMDGAERIAFKQNFIQKKAAELQKMAENQSIVSKTVNFAQRALVPFYEWYTKQNLVGKDSGFVSSMLPGNNLVEQFSYLMGLTNTDQFVRELTPVLDELSSRDPNLAISYLEGLISYGGSDAFMDNVFGVADIASVLPVGKLAGALKGVAKGAIKSPTELYKISTDLGRFDDAAIGKIVDEYGKGTLLKGDIRNAQEVENSTASISSPDKLMVGSQNVPQSAYLRLKQTVFENKELARRFLTEGNPVERATPEELVQYKDVLLDQYVKDHPSIQKNVIDVQIDPKSDVGNVYQAKVLIGRRDGTLFESAEGAENYFKRWIKGTDDYSIEQVGQGFQIAVKKNVDESKFLDFKLGTSQQTPTSFANTFGGWWRSANYQVSRENELARSTAVTSTEKLSQIYEAMAEPFQRLSKSDRKELNDLMEVNRDQQKYYENYGELEAAFWDRFKKPPTIEQAEAYFSYVQMNDLDLIVRDLDVYKQKAIKGIEDIRMKINGEDAAFEGKIVDRLPQDGDFRWVIVDNGKVIGKPKSASFSKFDKNKAEIEKKLSEGYKIIQVSDQALKVGDKQYAGFVITKDFSRNRIGLKNIDRRAGGHKVDSYPGYVKQAQINYGEKNLYKNDTTFFGVKTEKEGKELVEALEIARKKILNNEKDALKFIRDHLPISTQRFMKAIKDGVIDINTPFVYTKKGSRSIDTGAYSDLNLEDLSQNPHNLNRDILGRYLGQRDQSNIEVVRSEGDMKFEIRGAEYLSPMQTLQMASRNMLTVRNMNDYSLKTNRDFIREFGDILDGTRQEIESSGLAYLLNPKFKSGADAARVASAKNVSRAYKNLMNYGTELDRKIALYKDKLLSTIAPKLPEKFGIRNYVESRMLGSIKDPGVYLRSFAFDLKLGLFNPVQYFVQANSLVNVASIAGGNGLRGGLLYPFTRAGLLTNSPEIIEALAKRAERVGLMKSDEFKESLSLLKKSGFDKIGRDLSVLDDVSGPEMVTSGIKRTLELGRRPFQEGERLVRVAAWNAAYLEAKKRVGRKALTSRDEAIILQRAKDLTGNQTRESNAAWQKGYMAVFTQFFGYQARIMEQFLGTKLTSAEKLRLFLGYSAMYGLPVATGAVTGVLPIRDIVREQLAYNGVDLNDPAIEPFVDGFASSMIEFMTGYEPNVAGRYGPGGLPTFWELLRGDAEIYDIFLGASGSIGLQTVKDSMPILDVIRGERDFSGLTKDDFFQPLRNISSVDNAIKLWQVYNVGVWASRNGTNITEMNLPEGVIAALTGLQPAEIEDTFTKLRSTQDYKDHIKSSQKTLTKRWKRMMNMEPGPTRERERRDILAEMIKQLGLNPSYHKQVFERATNSEMLNDSIGENYDKMLQQRGMNGG